MPSGYRKESSANLQALEKLSAELNGIGSDKEGALERSMSLQDMARNVPQSTPPPTGNPAATLSPSTPDVVAAATQGLRKISQSNWDTTLHTPAYYKALNTLQGFEELNRDAEIKRREAVRGDVEEGFFPMTLEDEGEVSELTGLKVKAKVDPYLKSDMFRSNIHRINDAIDADLLQDEDNVAENSEPVQPRTSQFYLQKDANVIMQTRLSLHPHPSDPQPDSIEGPTPTVTPPHHVEQRTSQIDGVADPEDLSASLLREREREREEACEVDKERLAELKRKEEEQREADARALKQMKQLSEEEVSRIYKQEFTALFNAAQKVVKVKIDETVETDFLGKKPMDYFPCLSPSTSPKRNAKNTKTAKPSQSSAQIVNYLVEVSPAEGQNNGGNSLAHSVSASNLIEEKEKEKNGGGARKMQYTSPLWVIKVKILETILNGKFDLQHISLLVKAVRSCHQELEVTRYLLYRSEELLLREKRKNETLQTREGVALCRSKYRRAQLVQVANYIYSGIIQGNGKFEIPRIDADDPEQWSELNLIIESIVQSNAAMEDGGSRAKGVQQRAGVEVQAPHGQMFAELKYQTKLTKKEETYQRRMESIEQHAMEGEDALSAASAVFTVGNNIDINAVTVMRVLSSLVTAQSSVLLDSETASLLDALRPDTDAASRPPPRVEIGVQTDTTQYTEENFARLEEEISRLQEKVRGNTATIKAKSEEVRKAQDEGAKVLKAQKLLAERLEDQIRTAQRCESERALSSAVAKQAEEDLRENEAILADTNSKLIQRDQDIAVLQAKVDGAGGISAGLQAELEAARTATAEKQNQIDTLHLAAEAAENEKEQLVKDLVQHECEELINSEARMKAQLSEALDTHTLYLRDEAERLSRRADASTSTTPPERTDASTVTDKIVEPKKKKEKVTLGEVLSVAYDNDALEAERSAMYAKAIAELARNETAARGEREDAAADFMSICSFVSSFVVLVVNTSYPSCFKDAFSLNGTGKFSKMKETNAKISVLNRLKQTVSKLPPILKNAAAKRKVDGEEPQNIISTAKNVLADDLDEKPRTDRPSDRRHPRNPNDPLSLEKVLPKDTPKDTSIPSEAAPPYVPPSLPPTMPFAEVYEPCPVSMIATTTTAPTSNPYTALPILPVRTMKQAEDDLYYDAPDPMHYMPADVLGMGGGSGGGEQPPPPPTLSPAEQRAVDERRGVFADPFDLGGDAPVFPPPAAVQMMGLPAVSSSSSSSSPQSELPQFLATEESPQRGEEEPREVEKGPAPYVPQPLPENLIKTTTDDIGRFESVPATRTTSLEASVLVSVLPQLKSAEEGLSIEQQILLDQHNKLEEQQGELQRLREENEAREEHIRAQNIALQERQNAEEMEERLGLEKAKLADRLEELDALITRSKNVSVSSVSPNAAQAEAEYTLNTCLERIESCDDDLPPDEQLKILKSIRTSLASAIKCLKNKPKKGSAGPQPTGQLRKIHPSSRRTNEPPSGLILNALSDGGGSAAGGSYRIGGASVSRPVSGNIPKGVASLGTIGALGVQSCGGVPARVLQRKVPQVPNLMVNTGGKSPSVAPTKAESGLEESKRRDRENKARTKQKQEEDRKRAAAGQSSDNPSRYSKVEPNPPVGLGINTR